MTTSRHQRWLALFICVSALSLVAHLTNRFAYQLAFKTPTIRCGCPQAGWQYLERDSLHWAAPPPKSVSLPRLTAVRFATAPEEVRLPQMLLGEGLYSRPPPSC
ncbi:MAG: hypothetical protein LAN63_00080 [Acidobacteriia bacterium]|nr:hypothetical protein [Terriglobia bacterium]